MIFAQFTLDDFNFQKDLIKPYEYLLVVFYLGIIYTYSYIHRFRHYKKSPLKKYFIPAISVKILGAFVICLIYNYYYKGGDTSAYYNDGRLLINLFFIDPWIAIQLIFSTGGNIPDSLYQYVAGFRFADVESSFMIVKMSAFVQLFCFQSFLVTSLLFGFLSFWGIWNIFKLFTSFYPDLEKQFAISFLFLPSVFFWGSGILKDTVCLTALCWLFCCIHNVFIIGKNKASNVIGILLCSYIIIIVKVYIMMSFSLCIFILIFLNYRGRIKSKSLKNFITPIVIFVSIVTGFFLLKFIGNMSESGLYSVNNIMITAKTTREYLKYVSAEGAAYSLGDIENSTWGLIKVLPLAINATLFRPYLWEAHNFIAFFSAAENFLILLITIRMLIRVGPLKMGRITISHDLIFFCMIFSMLFAFSIGISNSNFGTLVRYKIPCIPFFVSGVFLIEYVAKKTNEAKKVQRIFNQ